MSSADNLVNTLFNHAHLTRNCNSGRRPGPKTFDAWLALQTVKITADEKKLKTGLFECAVAQQTQQMRPPAVWVFSTTELEQELKLEVPRKVQTFVMSSSNLAVASSAATKNKDNTKKVKAVNTTAGRAKRQLQVSDSSHYVSDNTTVLGAPVMDDALARKRARLSSGGGRGGIDDDELESSSAGVASSSMYSAPLPTNFYEVMTELLNIFWDLEPPLEPPVSFPFLAKIDSTNCKEYGLQAYAPRASSLSVIRDRLEVTNNNMIPQARQINAGTSGLVPAMPYKGAEDIYTDFREMFNNIYKYYPEDNPAYKKGKELDALFATNWEVYKKKLL